MVTVAYVFHPGGRHRPAPEDGHVDQLASTCCPKLAQQVDHVFAHRHHADPQILRDSLIRRAGTNTLEHFPLAHRENPQTPMIRAHKTLPRNGYKRAASCSGELYSRKNVIYAGIVGDARHPTLQQHHSEALRRRAHKHDDPRCKPDRVDPLRQAAQTSFVEYHDRRSQPRDDHRHASTFNTARDHTDTLISPKNAYQPVRLQRIEATHHDLHEGFADTARPAAVRERFTAAFSGYGLSAQGRSAHRGAFWVSRRGPGRVERSATRAAQGARSLSWRLSG
jgi:hypothetical protein